MENILKNFAPVTGAEDFSQFYSVYLKNRPPRYFMSTLYMSSFPGVFLHGIIDDCLVIVKRRAIMGNLSLYLIVPPMHKDGKYQKEMDLVDYFNDLGMATKLTEEDIADRQVNDDKYPEFVYNSEHFFDSLAGKAGQNFRSQINQFKKKQGELYNNTLQYGLRTDLTKLVQGWEKKKEVKSTQSRILKKLIDSPPSKGKFNILAPYQENVIGFSYTETLADNAKVIVARIRDDNDHTFNDPTLILHYLDCLGCSTPANLNIGGADKKHEAGLYFQKNKLRPIRIMDIYTTVPKRKLTRDEWHMLKPCPQNTFDFG